MTNRLAIILALATTAYGQEVSAISAVVPTKPVATVAPLSVASPGRKTWFAKRIGDNVFVGGRPTERAIKYLGEEGFKSIITLGTDSAASTFGDAAVPSSADEATLAFDSGLDFITVEPQGDASDVPTVVSTAFADFKAKLAAAPRPTYVHDDRNGATAAFFTSLVVLKADAAKVAAVEDQHRFGWWGEAEPNIQGAFSKLYVAETGAAAAPTAPSPQVVNQTAYWWAKRVTDRFYIAGQIWKNNLPAIKAAGFKSIVNFRQLPTDAKGAPSQEEVTLLNVDHTATYKNGTRESFRQKPANLEPKRIFPAAANAYIDIEGRTGSSVNYEVTNAQEFGDDVGYHAQIEEAAVKAAGLEYVGIPLSGEYTTEFVAKNIEPKISALVKAGKTPILLHCRTAVRAIFGAATYEVLVAKTVSADKAIAGANLVGYSYKTTEDNTTSWTNFGGVLTSTYTTAAAATATTGASDATPPPPPKSTTAPLSRAVTDTATNSVKVTSGVVRAAVSGAGLVLAAVVGAALAL